jgi:hypothetical protein
MRAKSKKVSREGIEPPATRRGTDTQGNSEDGHDRMTWLAAHESRRVAKVLKSTGYGRE